MMTIMTYLPDLLSGLMVTMILMLSSAFFGLILAVTLTAASYADLFIIRKIVDSFLFFIRGTPLLVQLFLIYFGLGQFGWIRDSSLWFLLREPMVCAIIALSLNTACYTTVILKGAIQSIPKNEIAAGEAIGMPKWLLLRRIIFPRAFRIATPAYSNEVMMILKSTSLASTITLLDVMGMTQKLISQTYDTVPLYLLAGLIYLLVNGVIMLMFKLIRSYY